jgi:hypothetical protein
MIDFKTAERVVLERLAADERKMNLVGSALADAKAQPHLHLVVSGVTEHECGWVFHYGTTEPLEPVDFGRFFPFGNAPFIVDKHDGRLYVTGTGSPIEHYVGKHRRGIRKLA